MFAAFFNRSNLRPSTDGLGFDQLILTIFPMQTNCIKNYDHFHTHAIFLLAIIIWQQTPFWQAYPEGH